MRFFLRVVLFSFLAAAYIFKYDGNDYSMYENYYNLRGLSFEIGYEALASLSKEVGLEFKYFYCIYGTLNFMLFGILSNWRSERLLLGLIPLMLFPGFPLNTIRQFTAALICAIAYERYYPDQNKKYVLWVIVACQFHISSVLFLAPLAWKKTGVFMLIAVAALGVLSQFSSYANLIATKINYYVDGNAREGWYEQSAEKSALFIVLAVLLLAGNYFFRSGDYKKYRPVVTMTAFAMLASAHMSIFMRFFYIFLPAISVWMYTCSRRVKWMVFSPLWIVGLINLYFVLAIWSGESYRHRNYLFDLFT